MSDIVAFGGDGHPQTMSSREIADLTGKRHDNVKRTVESLAEAGVIVRPQIEDEHETDALGRKRVTKVYLFEGEQGKRDSIVVVAQLCPEFTAKLVDRWQELEEQARNPFAAMIPQDYPSALRALADKSEEAGRLVAQIEHDAPKVAFAQQVEIAPDAISMGEAAKISGTGRTRLSSLLKRNRWLNRHGEPYQDKIEAGLLDVKLSSWEHPRDGLKKRVTPLITGKGLTRIVKMVRDEGLAA